MSILVATDWRAVYIYVVVFHKYQTIYLWYYRNWRVSIFFFNLQSSLADLPLKNYYRFVVPTMVLSKYLQQLLCFTFYLLILTLTCICRMTLALLIILWMALKHFFQICRCQKPLRWTLMSLSHGLLSQLSPCMLFAGPNI